MRPRRRWRNTRGVIRAPWVVALLVGAIATALPAAAAEANSTVPLTTCPIATALESWSNERLAAQTIVVPVDVGSVGSATTEVARGVGGIILFGTDGTSSLAESITALDRHAIGVKPSVMVDEEGGSVQRLAKLVGVMPSARTMAATMALPAIEALGAREGARLAALGVTVDLAPVLDLDAAAGPNDRDADGTRSFSANPTIATAAANAFAMGLRAKGILPVFKHFPGLGGASGNTDLVRATTLPYPALLHSGLIPFERVIAQRAGAIMVSNASVPGLSSLPSSISPTVITMVLRRELHFGGLVITDSLEVPSVTPKGGSLVRTVVAALGAGADMVLFNATAATGLATTNALIGGIVAAISNRTITRARLVSAVGRILTAKHLRPTCTG